MQKREQGFTILESVIALTILSIVVLAATNTYVFAAFRGKDAQNKTTALAYAAEQLERYKEQFSRDYLFDADGLLYHKGTNGQWTRYTVAAIPASAPRNNMVFLSALTVTSRKIDENSPTVGSSGVGASLQDNQLFQLTVDVSWPASAAPAERQSVRLTTFVKTR
ncbi:prepilin-type N-terminal cleavage/methylation domain-containing protein [Heliobacterium gestii]|uniref:Prepilin-type N-terminal cleavage/methylation domain-containing protein n=1 Tax=Heliomicrobium gestii TaxID=2699 RepID=A0A845LCM2_HELGE|nr:type II secretion system protein [Heliomicrobium gestii]MBM7867877.1 prepilin-type N-terminal cleavage/methylation domain-containing protein [Heliomicrobium gestii]MZP43311.1 prepilin-type N-terminal cleavage/methylation domain-containing protein [Heliomicrobium gestii]